MSKDPEIDAFRERLSALSRHTLLAPHVEGDALRLAELEISEVQELIRDEDVYYLLIAAAGLNRTAIKRAMRDPEAQIVSARQRKAFAIRARLPAVVSFQATVTTALALREADLGRKRRGGVERLFRERLAHEGIPILMSPPVRRVPGLLIDQRKPDGVYPDPADGSPPRLYLEVKNVRRVADDIQKRLYEIAEVSIEMKAIYGDLALEGLGVTRTAEVEGNADLRARIRSQITSSDPIVVALLICPRDEAERYRQGAETFIDRVFFQDEIQECLDYLRETIERIDRR